MTSINYILTLFLLCEVSGEAGGVGVLSDDSKL